MDCDRVRVLLDGYIDDELDLVNALEVDTHLKDCPACTQKFAELKAIRSAISGNRGALFFVAPPGLQKRIKTSLPGSKRVFPILPKWQWGWLAAAAFTIAVLVFGVGMARGWFAPGQNDLLAEEVQSAHVRSLMASHLTDVTSTNQHTVKPWFDGKLDFSPPVEDLAAQGFPLVGGRLDYLDGHPVAALVYRYNQHDINLFIWPSIKQVQGLHAATINGYNLYQWHQSGMEYWAASDLNAGELRSFIELVQKGVQ
ncbi:MAG: anti-sigma factor [Anaerolineaceae bacterium]|nr:anti-sigma factor [Anaerolineaceae bacterium]